MHARDRPLALNRSKIIWRTVAVLVVMGAVARGVAMVLERPDEIWEMGLSIASRELVMVASLITLAGCLAIAGVFLPKRRWVIGTVVILLLGVVAIPFSFALSRPARVAMEFAARPRIFDDVPLPSDSEAVTFLVVGDTGHEPEIATIVGKAMAREAETVEHPVAGVWLLGDLVERHGEPNADYLKTRAECIDEPMAPLTSKQLPLMGILGNHDYDNRFTDEMANDPLLHMNGQSYYARRFGDLVTFFVIDSDMLREQPEQVLWLQEALEADTSEWSILLLHHPMLASEFAHGGDQFRHGALEELIYGKYPVELVLSGHNHLYERRQPLNGVTHVTVGSGSRKPEGELPDDPGRAVGITGRNIFLELTIDRERIAARAIDRENNVLDEFEIPRPAPVATVKAGN